ncbi:ParB/RepB/Spo0J family partition protein [Streptomyces sp. NPDC060030]|uniref:ParB/RepB/Spo0J family partition protein n=1 Tax=Streptomyces sp. NPDC060030 TaxID=3347042 RepID=UPI0036944362
MSKADKLGAGSSFGQTKAISSRRVAINAVTSAPTDGAPPPVKLSVDLISLNPDNPRSELGDLSDLSASLRDHGQKTAISVMGRFAYLEGNPGQEDSLEPGTRYVVIDGNSRLSAAREAGIAEIKVMLDDELGSNPDEILESALVANIHRRDLDHLDEAKALKQLLDVHGTQEALAARLHRSQGWVSQRLALLSLTPELKQKLQAGEEPAALLRRVGKKKAEEQEAHLRHLKEKEAQQAADRKQLADGRVNDTPSPSQSPAPAEQTSQEPDVKPKRATKSEPRTQGHGVRPHGSPEKTAETSFPSPREVHQPAQLPSQDPAVLSALIIEELDIPSRRKLTELLVDYKIEESMRMRAEQAVSSQSD